MMRRAFSFALAALLLVAGLAGTPARADTLVDNVNGLTLDADGRLVRFAGLVIDRDGRVKQLLQRSDKRPDRVDFRLDGLGRTLMPGFIDAHGHVMGLGFARMLLDLSDTRSLDEALARIKTFADENPGLPWIMGGGWNQERWGLGRFPTAAELDSVTGGRPTWLNRVDGHAGWANSAAMAAAKVDARTASPAGGRIEKDAAGRPSGIFVDAAMAIIDAAKPQPLARDYDLALQLAQADLLAHGITTITDMGTTLAEWQAFRRAGDLGQLNIRIIAYAGDVDNMAIIGGPGPTPWLYDDRLRMVGVKLYLDGALGSRGAWLIEPYADAPRERGLPLTDGTTLRNKMVRANMDGFQVALHAIGDAANREALNAIADLADNLPAADRRFRIEHAQVVAPDDIARFGAMNVIASMQPVHQTSDRVMAEARLDPARLAGAYAWASLRRGGARLAFGSDVPVESADPFAGLAAAMSRTGPDGQPFGGWRPEEAVGREVALDGFTRSAAFAGRAEDRLGTLMPGMRADFVLLDDDPMLASPSQIRAMRVAETWVGGQRRHVRSTAR